MQSDGNSFYGDVISDSFKTCRGEDKIVDHMYQIKYVYINIMMIFFIKLYENAY